MGASMGTAAGIVGTGIIATAIFDLWGQTLTRTLGLPPPAWHVAGRWFASCARGRLYRPTIAAEPPVQGESAIGWTVHYAIGIVYAAFVVAIAGPGWLGAPTLWPALAVGVATIAAGWFVMSPCMGNGIAASRSENPWLARCLQLVAHIVFGLGLYLGGLAVAALSG